MPYKEYKTDTARRRAAREETRRKMRAHQAFLAEYKMARGCVDCGYCEHPAALEFDHRDPATKMVAKSGKRITVSGMATWARHRVLEEIEKCDVRCCNCHSIRTSEEGHWNRRFENRTGPVDVPVRFRQETLL